MTWENIKSNNQPDSVTFPIKKKMLKMDFEFTFDILNKTVECKQSGTDDISEDLSALLGKYLVIWSRVVYDFIKEDLLKSKGVTLRPRTPTHLTHYHMRSKLQNNDRRKAIEIGVDVSIYKATKKTKFKTSVAEGASVPTTKDASTLNVPEPSKDVTEKKKKRKVPEKRKEIHRENTNDDDVLFLDPEIVVSTSNLPPLTPEEDAETVALASEVAPPLAEDPSFTLSQEPANAEEVGNVIEAEETVELVPPHSEEVKALLVPTNDVLLQINADAELARQIAQEELLDEMPT
nr:oxysterol-binding protein homolog 1-like [Ipomoea batatas]